MFALAPIGPGSNEDVGEIEAKRGGDRKGDVEFRQLGDEPISAVDSKHHERQRATAQSESRCRGGVRNCRNPAAISLPQRVSFGSTTIAPLLDGVDQLQPGAPGQVGAQRPALLCNGGVRPVPRETAAPQLPSGYSRRPNKK